MSVCLNFKLTLHYNNDCSLPSVTSSHKIYIRCKKSFTRGIYLESETKICGYKLL